MLDLSSGLRQHPFFALAGRYHISEAPLSLSHFYVSHFSLPLFSLSQHLAISLTYCAVLALSCLCLSTLPFLRIFFFCQGRRFFFWLFATSFLPLLVIHPFSSSLVSDSSLSPLFFSQAKRSQAACPDLSVPVNVLAWRLWCAAVTSTSTHCPKASPGT